jgi:hypothetical protein
MVFLSDETMSADGPLPIYVLLDDHEILLVSDYFDE